MGLNLLSGCQGFYMCVQALGSRPNPAIAMHRRDGMLGGHQCVEILYCRSSVDDGRRIADILLLYDVRPHGGSRSCYSSRG